MRRVQSGCVRHAALEQRARLLQAVWHDVQGERRSVRHDILPHCLLTTAGSGGAPLNGYAAVLTYCDDDVWRVMRDYAGQHPGASFLEAPILAVFLPALCRFLLGQTLQLASLPVLWLGDADTRRIFVGQLGHPWIRDGLTPGSEILAVTGMQTAKRALLQAMVDAEPHRFVAGFDAHARNSVRHVRLSTDQSIVTH